MIKWIRKYWKTFCAGFLFGWVFLSMIQIARIECKLVKLEKKYDAFAGVVKEFDDWQVTVNKALKMFD